MSRRALKSLPPVPAKLSVDFASPTDAGMSAHASPSRQRSRTSSNSSDNTVRTASADPLHHQKSTREPTVPQSEVASLWLHDESFSKEEVLVNPDTFRNVSLSSGDLVQIVALKLASDVRDFEKSTGPPQTNSDDPINPGNNLNDEDNTSAALSFSKAGAFDVDSNTKYFFIAKSLPPDLKAKHASLQVSLNGTIANIFGFPIVLK